MVFYSVIMAMSVDRQIQLFGDSQIQSVNPDYRRDKGSYMENKIPAQKNYGNEQD